MDFLVNGLAVATGVAVVGGFLNLIRLTIEAQCKEMRHRLSAAPRHEAPSTMMTSQTCTDMGYPRWKSPAFRDGVLVGVGICVFLILVWAVLP